MQTLNQSLFDLYSRGMISGEDARAFSNDTEELRAMVEGRARAPQQGGNVNYR